MRHDACRGEFRQSFHLKLSGLRSGKHGAYFSNNRPSPVRAVPVRSGLLDERFRGFHDVGHDADIEVRVAHVSPIERVEHARERFGKKFFQRDASCNRLGLPRMREHRERRKY